MARAFNEACRLAERIPTMELTTHFFWSVMYEALAPEDRIRLVEELMDRVTSQKEESDEE